MFYKYNTIDIDNGDYENFERIYNKVQACKHHGAVMFKDTKKGFHILLKCDIDCELCRMVFDDPYRYERDFKRKDSRKNVLFEPFSGTERIK